MTAERIEELKTVCERNSWNPNASFDVLCTELLALCALAQSAAEANAIMIRTSITMLEIGKERDALRVERDEARKPWKVNLSLPVFEQLETQILDVGYSDRILLVSCPVLQTRMDDITRQRDQLAAEVTRLRADGEMLDWLLKFIEENGTGGIAEGGKQ